ncbi:type II secretion system protein J [Flavobacterium sp. MXW15]|nr:type II secretion system protein J [Flavobacterium sp. MXW15]
MSAVFRRRDAGFTLIEVLLATLLLAGGLALAFATVRSAMAVSARGEALAAQSERLRAVEGFLRRRLSSALPVAMAQDEESGLPQRFAGEPRRMRFVADVPDYLGRGGPYLHDLAVVGAPGALRLELSLTLVQDGEQIAEQPPRPPEALADGLQSVRIRYRGVEPQTGTLGDWQEQWEAHERLPVLVSIEVEPAQGSAWPPLLVALPQYGNAGVAP